jgi:DNA-binding GntR family transcriptional regulator
MADNISSNAHPGVAPIESPVTLRQAIVEQLRIAIVSCAIVPGTLLRETALAHSLGVSATPLREAFGVLAAEGLVEIQAHRLKRVSPIDFKETLDLFRVQSELWRLGYVWGLAKITSRDLLVLETAVTAYRDALAADDPAGVMSAAHEFHTAIIMASGNSELLRSTLDRRALIARFILLHGKSTLSRSGLRHHEAMLRAIKRGDSADVLARLDQISARLIAIAQNAAADSTNIIKFTS